MTTKPYQITQIFVARLVCKRSRKDDAHICLQELHWLLIKHRTVFKLITIVYNTHYGQESQYLKEELKYKQFHRTKRK